MDQTTLEEKMIECQELQEGFTWNTKWIMLSAVVAVGGITVATYESERASVNAFTITRLGAGFLIVSSGTVALGMRWFRRKVQCARGIIHQSERTKAALKKRKQIYFSISMRIPCHRNPLILRACRIAVSAIEYLTEKTKLLNNGSSWQELYSDEIRRITARSSENPDMLEIEDFEEEGENEIDFETVFETLIAILKLHISEYCRVVIVDFLNSSKFEFRKFQSFLRTCNVLREYTHNLEAIQKSALKSEVEKAKNSKRAETKNSLSIGMDINWKQQTAMALEAILESLETESISHSEVEIALHKTLVMIGSEKVDRKPEVFDKIQLKTNDETFTGTIVIEKGSGERTDVFEGFPLSEADKAASKSAAVARDVLLDGSESRRHEANLFGELQMVLEPRRTDFAKRERAALAKFYGVEETQLEKEEKKEEMTFEGVGAGGDEQPEPHDWRKDAETSAGLHQEADNDDFLKALKLRRVDDDIIE